MSLYGEREDGLKICKASFLSLGFVVSYTVCESDVYFCLFLGGKAGVVLILYPVDLCL